jgi:SynChlorMet cassette radical SAM/SPASM protein ScmF
MIQENVSEKKEDKIQFPIRQIYAYIVADCNLICRHCWLSPKHQSNSKMAESLSIDIFKSILDQAKPLGLKSIKLTGGEPLLHPKISEILQIIKDYPISLSIETNGTLCTKEIAREIASIKNSSAAVSLDGADCKTHEWVRGVKGCFDEAVKGIKNLVETGIQTQIIMSVMKHNQGQIEKMVRLGETLRASSIKFNIVQPTGRGEKLIDGGETLSIEQFLSLGEFVNNTLSSSTKLRLHFDLPLAFRPLSKMFGEKGDGCATCGILGILGVLANGSYALCGIGNHIPELVFGDASRDPLEDVWNNNKVLIELREGIPLRFEGICGTCHMKRVCSDSCIAQNYYSSKSLWKSFWFCDEAYKRGLFPLTRTSKH